MASQGILSSQITGICGAQPRAPCTPVRADVGQLPLVRNTVLSQVKVASCSPKMLATLAHMVLRPDQPTHR